MEEYTVSNMQELFDAVSEIKVTHPVIWFRGLSKISYKLEPSIYRSPYNAKKHEAQLLGRFKSLSPSYLKSIPQDDWQWLFLMQHYGIPTRLMDWTESPIIALIFALHKIECTAPTEDACIYGLDPIVLNKNVKGFVFNDNNPIPFIGLEQERLFGTLNDTVSNLPLAIIGPHNNSRIIAQKGTFTIFPHTLFGGNGLTDVPEKDDFLVKLILDKNSLVKMKKNLEDAKLTYNGLFPELNSIADDVKKMI